MKSIIRLVSWNVNGLRAVLKKNALSPVISNLDPDILCLQETKAEKHQVELELPQYLEYWNNSQEKKGYSGTASFSKYTPYNVFYNLPQEIIDKYKLKHDGYGHPNKEGRVITLEYESFYVVNVYTPNAKPNLERLELRHKIWDPAFKEYVSNLDKQKPVIICGDFNVAHKEIDLARPKENEGHTGFTKEEREGIDNLIKAGFVDTFRLFTKEGGHYSWWSYRSFAREKNIGWRIDYIFASQRIKDAIVSSEIHPEFEGSDHCPVSAQIDIEKIKQLNT